MDRPRVRESFRHRKVALVAGGLCLLSGVAFGIAKLEPSAPAVAREQLYLDEVKEGTLERKVRGPGVLQPREARWLSTRVEARVDRVLVRAGETVEPDTVIVQLSNPEVERAADAATLEVAAARAEYAAARLELQSQRLDRRSSLAEARATAESARLQAVAEERAFQKGAVSQLQYSRSKIEAGQLGERAEIEEQRLTALDSAVNAQLEARLARLRQLERAAEEQRLAADSLSVKAAIAGVVQSVPVQEGQQLAPGANVARVAKPGTLYAELRIPELDARDLAPGLAAVIDLRDRLVRGRVVRVDPAVAAGAVRVEVDLDETAAHAGARRPLGRRHDRDRDPGERALRRPPGRRAVRRRDHGIPREAGRHRRRARAGEVREGVREPDRRARGARARRHRGARGHHAMVR